MTLLILFKWLLTKTAIMPIHLIWICSFISFSSDQIMGWVTVLKTRAPMMLNISKKSRLWNGVIANIHLKTASHLCSYFLLLFSPIIHHVIYTQLLGKENSQRAAFTFYTDLLKVSILLGTRFDHHLTLLPVGAIYLAEQRRHVFLTQFDANP